MQEEHEMILNGRPESGAEEWGCPSCGRRVLLRWPPNYERLVLEHGDETAIHVGSKGGAQMGGIGITRAATADLPGEARQWLRDNGIDWDGTPT